MDTMTKMNHETKQETRKPVVEVRNITKDYVMGEITLQVLKGISLTVYEGEFVSIMGPSGSGKSTLMNMLGALDQPTSGEYLLAGVDVAKLNAKQLAKIPADKCVERVILPYPTTFLQELLSGGSENLNTQVEQ